MTAKHLGWKPEDVATMRGHLVSNKFNLGGYPGWVGLVGTLNRVALATPAPKHPDTLGQLRKDLLFGRTVAHAKDPVDPHEDWQNRVAEAFEDPDLEGIDETPSEFAPRSAASHANKSAR